MKQRDFDDEETFIRLCNYQRQIRDKNGKLIGVTWEAFALRTQKDEDYASGACKDVFSGSSKEMLLSAVEAILASFAPSAKRDTYAILELPAKDIKEVGVKHDRDLRVRLEPKRNNKGYSAVRRLPLDNSNRELLNLLSRTPNRRLSLVKDI